MVYFVVKSRILHGRFKPAKYWRMKMAYFWPPCFKFWFPDDDANPWSDGTEGRVVDFLRKKQWQHTGMALALALALVSPLGLALTLLQATGLARAVGHASLQKRNPKIKLHCLPESRRQAETTQNNIDTENDRGRCKFNVCFMGLPTAYVSHIRTNNWQSYLE